MGENKILVPAIIGAACVGLVFAIGVCIYYKWIFREVHITEEKAFPRALSVRIDGNNRMSHRETRRISRPVNANRISVNSKHQPADANRNSTYNKRASQRHCLPTDSELTAEGYRNILSRFYTRWGTTLSREEMDITMDTYGQSTAGRTQLDTELKAAYGQSLTEYYIELMYGGKNASRNVGSASSKHSQQSTSSSKDKAPLEEPQDTITRQSTSSHSSKRSHASSAPGSRFSSASNSSAKSSLSLGDVASTRESCRSSKSSRRSSKSSASSKSDTKTRDSVTSFAKEEDQHVMESEEQDLQAVLESEGCSWAYPVLLENGICKLSELRKVEGIILAVVFPDPEQQETLRKLISNLEYDSDY